MNKTILQTISLQDYVKRLWNHSNTKIPVTIGKGTDTAKPNSKAPYRGNNFCNNIICVKSNLNNVKCGVPQGSKLSQGRFTSNRSRALLSVWRGSIIWNADHSIISVNVCGVYQVVSWVFRRIQFLAMLAKFQPSDGQKMALFGGLWTLIVWNTDPSINFITFPML